MRMCFSDCLYCLALPRAPRPRFLKGSTGLPEQSGEENEGPQKLHEVAGQPY